MWLKKHKFNSLIKFHSANKINNYNRGGGEKWKKIKRICRISQNIRIMSVFLESLLSESFPSLSHKLPRMPSNTVLISGPAVGAALILIWSYSCVSLPPMSTAIRASACSSVGALSVLYIFHRQRVCLVDHVDLICSLNSWGEGLGSSSLATLSLGFNCGFISTSACGSSMGVCSWGCPGGLGFAPVGARCGGGELLGLQGFWLHQVFGEVGS